MLPGAGPRLLPRDARRAARRRARSSGPAPARCPATTAGCSCTPPTSCCRPPARSRPTTRARCTRASSRRSTAAAPSCSASSPTRVGSDDRRSPCRRGPVGAGLVGPGQQRHLRPAAHAWSVAAARTARPGPRRAARDPRSPRPARRGSRCRAHRPSAGRWFGLPGDDRPTPRACSWPAPRRCSAATASSPAARSWPSRRPAASPASTACCASSSRPARCLRGYYVDDAGCRAVRRPVDRRPACAATSSGRRATQRGRGARRSPRPTRPTPSARPCRGRHVVDDDESHPAPAGPQGRLARRHARRPRSCSTSSAAARRRSCSTTTRRASPPRPSSLGRTVRARPDQPAHRRDGRRRPVGSRAARRRAARGRVRAHPQGSDGSMPEGDTVWRTAHHLHEALAGRELTGTDFRVPAVRDASTCPATWSTRSSAAASTC